MSLVVLEDVGLEFADRVLFSGLGLRIAEGDRIGLIGPNGSGKTSLLRILSGEQAASRGAVVRSRGLTIGYLPQDLEVAGGITLRELVLGSVPGRADLDERLAAAEAELESLESESRELMEAAARVADLHERVDHFERYYSEHEAMQILAGLGFAPDDPDRDLEELSGGWRMRGVLAAILFQRPDLMLLDEPTNHLDLPSVGWFSDFLKAWKQAFVLISHDREFLNEQIRRVVSLEVEGVRQHTGDFEAYLAWRAEQEVLLEAKAKNLARERERVQRFIDRFRAKNTKATAVQSRVKALEKMEEVETLQERKSMRFSFPPVERCGDIALRAQSLAMAFGDRPVFSKVELEVRRGERIAIIGPNGAGKTTLLRLLAAELEPTEGTVELGAKVQLGYYAQHHADALDREATVFEEVERADPEALPARVRSVCGAFLFSGDDVDKKVSVLSGGERARVALARLLLVPGNLILMDEPTNHLDLASSESLAQALADFEGTLVFVSHNRSLIRTLATRIWNVEDGAVDPYPGTLDEYFEWRRGRRLESERAAPKPASTAEPAAEPAQPPARSSRDQEKERKRREAELRNRKSRVLGPIRRRIEELERRIGELESSEARRTEALSDPATYDDAARRDRLLAEQREAEGELEALTAEWEQAMEELEAAQLDLGAELS